MVLGETLGKQDTQTLSERAESLLSCTLIRASRRVAPRHDKRANDKLDHLQCVGPRHGSRVDWERHDAVYCRDQTVNGAFRID